MSEREWLGALICLPGGGTEVESEASTPKCVYTFFAKSCRGFTGELLSNELLVP